MKTKLTFIILATMVIFPCFASPSDDYDQINNLLLPGEIPVTTTLMPIHDKDAFLPQGNPDGSLTIFKKNNFQVRIMPMTFSGVRSASEKSTEEFNESIKQYEENIKTNPSDYDACIMLASLYIERGADGDADLAINHSSRALTLQKDDPHAFYLRGLAYHAKGDAPSRIKALDDFEQVLKTDIPDMQGIYYVMGMIYYREDNINKAIETFEKVTAIDPDFADVKEILEMLKN
jgi:tetratricopeptide (TPR) repeat protein